MFFLLFMRVHCLSVSRRRYWRAAGWRTAAAAVAAPRAHGKCDEPRCCGWSGTSSGMTGSAGGKRRARLIHHKDSYCFFSFFFIFLSRFIFHCMCFLFFCFLHVFFFSFLLFCCSSAHFCFSVLFLHGLLLTLVPVPVIVLFF